VTGVAQKRPEKNRTASRDVRRKQLIKAAIDSISKRGFSGTTLKHVTEGAKLSHGVVNFHFDSKETLYDETLGYLVREHYDLWQDAMRRAGTRPEDQLTAIINSDFDDKVCSTKNLAVWFAFWGQAKYRPNYLKIHNNYDEERFVEIENLCAKIIEDGKYQHLNAGSVARTIEALVDGCWLSMMLYPSSAKRQQYKADCFLTLAEFFPNHFSRSVGSQDSKCDLDG